MISITTVVYVILYLIVGGIIFGLLKLLIDKAPFMPDAWKPYVNYILLLLAVLVLIGILIGLITDRPLFRA